MVIGQLISSFSQQRGLAIEPLAGCQVLFEILLAWGNYKPCSMMLLLPC